MLAGEQGPVRQWAMRHQIAVGEFFDAADFVPVGQAHIMADTESLGEAGVAWLEGLAAAAARTQRRVRIPTITDPRGLDFASYKRLKQTDAMADIEARAIARLRGAGRADDQHLHQLPDHPAAGARRAPGARRHRRRHLLQQRDGRAQQLRGRALGAGRRAHRAARRATATISTRIAPAPAISRSSIEPARLRRLGRARRHRRPRRQQLLAGAGRHGARRACPAPTSSSISARRWRASARWPCSTCRA